MNRTRLIGAGAWTLAALVTLISVGAWSKAVPAPATTPAAAAASWRKDIGSPMPVDSGALALAAAHLRDRDPFRWDRKPTTVRFNPWQPATAVLPVAPARPPRPAVALTGVVGGPPWTALVEGIPGREGGVLLRVGEEVGGIRLVGLRGDTAQLSGFDTTWTLTPRRAWH